jgi:hypothetical protein
MAPRDWLARWGSKRIDRRQAGLLGAALLALFVETEPADARRRKGKSRSAKRAQAEKKRSRNQATPRFCGGIAGIPCPDGFICVDDPGDNCDPQQGGADCGGICVRKPKNPRFCGGIAGIPCPRGFTCVDDPSDDCDPQTGVVDCGGICIRKVKDPCATVRCRKGTHCCRECGRACIPDTVSCKEACGFTPCNEATCGPGEYCCNESCSRCVKLGQGCTREICPPKPLGGEPCGGIAGIPCPEGFICVDDPGDDCDPKRGGADCGGICVRGSGEPCGKTRCGPGEYCCNPSCGTCVPLNGGCAAVVCDPDPEPWPGERCGKTICPRGQVCCNASCGICTPPNAACIMIACVEEIVE